MEVITGNFAGEFSKGVSSAMEDVVTCLNYWMVLTMGTLALRLLMARWTRWSGKLNRFGANPA